jgi:hypothetical protein
MFTLATGAPPATCAAEDATGDADDDEAVRRVRQRTE